MPPIPVRAPVNALDAFRTGDCNARLLTGGHCAAPPISE
jgi:hypothetical protein